MKIVIIGAGQVGGTLAEHLAYESNDVTIVDSDVIRLQELQQRSDIQVIHGYGTFPRCLKRAGTQNADMLVAVTNSDECNMVACEVAAKLFHTPSKIARIRSQEYLDHGDLFHPEAIAIDVIISPEKLVTDAIERIIQYPGTIQVLDFADGKILLGVVEVEHGSRLCDVPISKLSEQLPNSILKIVAIYRQNRAVNLSEDCVFQHGDEVFFLSPQQDFQNITYALRHPEGGYRKIMIAGGGHIGTNLAQRLEKNYPVKLIERDRNKAHSIANMLHSTIVLHGDCADKMLLLNENIDDEDIFCAVTNDDEANIMAALLAKHLGAKKVMALITRGSYVELIEASNIDVVISPQQTTLSGLLSHVRKGDIVKVHALRRGAAEAIEVIAHGDKNNSKVVGRPLRDVALPKGTTIGAIVRGTHVIIAEADTIIESDDHIILFLADKAKISDVEKLFQVGLGFF